MASWFDVYIWGITFRWRSLSLRVVSPLQIKDTPGISWVTLMKPLPLAGKDGKCLGHLFPSISFHPHQKKALYNNNVIYIYIIICPHDSPIMSASKISLQILYPHVFFIHIPHISAIFQHPSPDVTVTRPRRILKDDDTLESTKADGSWEVRYSYYMVIIKTIMDYNWDYFMDFIWFYNGLFTQLLTRNR